MKTLDTIVMLFLSVTCGWFATNAVTSALEILATNLPAKIVISVLVGAFLFILAMIRFSIYENTKKLNSIIKHFNIKEDEKA